jgi:hypothetical protein
MIRDIFTLLCILSCFFINVHAVSAFQTNELPEQEKSEIIESILEKEIPFLEGASPFDIWDRYLSTENINFFQISLKLSSNFKAIKPTEIQEILNGESVQIWTFHNFKLKDEIVVVKVSTVEREVSCYRGYLTVKRELSYQYRKVDGRWMDEMTKRVTSLYPRL